MPDNLPDNTADINQAVAMMLTFLSQYIIYDMPDTPDPDMQDLGMWRTLYWKGRFYRKINTAQSADGTRIIEDNNSPANKFIWIPHVIPKSFKSFITDPPANPRIGDIYILNPAPTGILSGHGKQMAMYLGVNEYSYMRPEFGDESWNEADGQKYHYDLNGNWVSGVSDNTLLDDAVSIRKITSPPLQIIQGLTNTDPGGTGAGTWILQGNGVIQAGTTNNQLAHRDTAGVWKFETPIQGMQVKDIGANVTREFNGTTWELVTTSSNTDGFEPIEITNTVWNNRYATATNTNINRSGGSEAPIILQETLDSNISWLEVKINEDITFSPRIKWTGTDDLVILRLDFGLQVRVGNEEVALFKSDNITVAGRAPGFFQPRLNINAERTIPSAQITIPVGEKIYRIPTSVQSRVLSVRMGMIVTSYGTGSGTDTLNQNTIANNPDLKFINITTPNAIDGIVTVNYRLN